MNITAYFQKTKSLARRQVVQMISEKAVKIDGRLVESLSQEVHMGQIITVTLLDWKIFEEKVEKLPIIKPKIVLFNKPKGYVVSKEDPHEKTIYELLPPSRKKDFYYIGRLDKDTHGLLLLTNDTALVDHYESPSSHIHKSYTVIIDQEFKTAHIQKCKKWILVDENWIAVTPASEAKGLHENVRKDILKAVNIMPFKEKNQYGVIVILDEGKKRHIRRMLSALGYRVKDLMRTRVGIYKVDSIKEGKYAIVDLKTTIKKWKPKKEKQIKKEKAILEAQQLKKKKAMKKKQKKRLAS